LLPPADCRFFHLFTQRYWNRACPRHVIIFSRSDALPRLEENATLAFGAGIKIPTANQPREFLFIPASQAFLLSALEASNGTNVSIW